MSTRKNPDVEPVSINLENFEQQKVMLRYLLLVVGELFGQDMTEKQQAEFNFVCSAIQKLIANLGEEWFIASYELPDDLISEKEIGHGLLAIYTEEQIQAEIERQKKIGGSLAEDKIKKFEHFLKIKRGEIPIRRRRTR